MIRSTSATILLVGVLFARTALGGACDARGSSRVVVHGDKLITCKSKEVFDWVVPSAWNNATGGVLDPDALPKSVGIKFDAITWDKVGALSLGVGKQPVPTHLQSIPMDMMFGKSTSTKKVIRIASTMSEGEALSAVGEGMSSLAVVVLDKGVTEQVNDSVLKAITTAIGKRTYIQVTWSYFEAGAANSQRAYIFDKSMPNNENLLRALLATLPQYFPPNFQAVVILRGRVELTSALSISGYYGAGQLEFITEDLLVASTVNDNLDLAISGHLLPNNSGFACANSDACVRFSNLALGGIGLRGITFEYLARDITGLIFEQVIGRVEVDRNYFSGNRDYLAALNAEAIRNRIQTEMPDISGSDLEPRVTAGLALRSNSTKGKEAIKVLGPSDVFFHNNAFARLEDMASIGRFGSLTVLLKGFFNRNASLGGNHIDGSAYTVNIDPTSRVRFELDLSNFYPELLTIGPPVDLTTYIDGLQEFRSVYGASGTRDSTRLWCVNLDGGALVDSSAEVCK